MSTVKLQNDMNEPDSEVLYEKKNTNLNNEDEETNSVTDKSESDLSEKNDKPENADKEDNLKKEIKDVTGDTKSTISLKSTASSTRSIYNPNYADTHSRIFGNYPTDDNAPAPTRRNSNMGGEKSLLLNTSKQSVSIKEERDVPFNGKKPDGNPLTGEGYATEYRGPHLKVPPGGFSSGIFGKNW